MASSRCVPPFLGVTRLYTQSFCKLHAFCKLPEMASHILVNAAGSQDTSPMEADPDVLVMGGPMVQGAPMPRELSTAWPAQLCCSASLPASRCGRPESHPWPHALVNDVKLERPPVGHWARRERCNRIPCARYTWRCGLSRSCRRASSGAPSPFSGRGRNLHVGLPRFSMEDACRVPARKERSASGAAAGSALFAAA